MDTNNRDESVYLNKNGVLVNKYGEVYGYARVSTVQQKVDRQLDELKAYGVPTSHTFVDKFSGKTFNRPAYRKLMRIIRKGDVVVIKSIDRLGRNYEEIQEQFRLITQDIGCGLHIIDMPMLNTSGDPGDLLNKFMSDMILQVLSFTAQNERETTLSRQREGLEAAKRRRKVRIGRAKKKMSFDFWEIFLMWKTKEYRVSDLFRFCHETWGISYRTFYRRIHELDARFGDFTPEQLQNLILDEEFFDGIEYANERMEAGIDYWNPYVLNDPHKEEIRRKTKRKERESMSKDEIREEEEKTMRKMQEKRQAEFRKRFNIDYRSSDDISDVDSEGYIHLIPRQKPKKTELTNHSKTSGIELGYKLIDDEPIIPDIHPDDSAQSPMRTIIIT